MKEETYEISVTKTAGVCPLKIKQEPLAFLSFLGFCQCFSLHKQLLLSVWTVSGILTTQWLSSARINNLFYL